MGKDRCSTFKHNASILDKMTRRSNHIFPINLRKLSALLNMMEADKVPSGRPKTWLTALYWVQKRFGGLLSCSLTSTNKTRPHSRQVVRHSEAPKAPAQSHDAVIARTCALRPRILMSLTQLVISEAFLQQGVKGQCMHSIRRVNVFE